MVFKITTGLSDFHNVVIRVLKAAFTKSKLKVITYGDFKLFNEETFKTDLKNSLRITNISSYHVKFDFHMVKVCSKTNRKLTILSRMFKFLTFKKRRVLIKAHFESQFKHCPLVWSFMEDKLIIK